VFALEFASTIAAALNLKNQRDNPSTQQRLETDFPHLPREFIASLSKSKHSF
jgi:hypothetical protein